MYFYKFRSQGLVSGTQDWVPGTGFGHSRRLAHARRAEIPMRSWFPRSQGPGL